MHLSKLTSQMSALAIFALQILVIASLQGIGVYSQSISSVEANFSAASIVPDVLPAFQPTSLLSVVFNGTAPVTPGVNLTMAETLNEPAFFLESNDTSLLNGTFVLAIVDPDAPTPQAPNISQFRHMLAGDFHVNGSAADLATGLQLTNTSAALTDFVNPTPPIGSDPHRYVVLLFVQPADFASVAPSFVNASTVRTNFNITVFASEVGLAPPIAGNFFLTGPDNTTNTASSTAASASATNPSSSGSSPAATTSSSGAIRLGIHLEHEIVVIGVLGVLLAHLGF